MPKGYPALGAPIKYRGEFIILNLQTGARYDRVFEEAIVEHQGGSVVINGTDAGGVLSTFIGYFDCGHMDFEEDEIPLKDRGNVSISAWAKNLRLIDVMDIKRELIDIVCLDRGLVKVTVNLSNGKRAIAIGQLAVKMTTEPR